MAELLERLRIYLQAGRREDLTASVWGKERDEESQKIQKEETADEILFYNRDDPYFEFTNFAEFPIVLDGKQWPTSEHYFQAQKFVGTPYLNYICTLPTPRDAFSLSRQPQVSQWLRSDWETVKQDVMYKALLAKFSQHSDLRDMLLATGGKRIVEHTANDSYWGDGGNGSGQNNLGKLLMSIRCVLQNPSKKLPDNSMPINILPSTDLDELLNTNISGAKLTSDAKVTAEQPSGQEAQLNTINVTRGTCKSDILVSEEQPSGQDAQGMHMDNTSVIEEQPSSQPNALKSSEYNAKDQPSPQEAQQPAAVNICTRVESDALGTAEQPSGQPNALKSSECNAKDQPSPQEAQQPAAVNICTRVESDALPGTAEQPSGQEAQSNTINVTQGKPDALATGELPSTEETPPDALKSTQGESHAESIEKQPTAQPDAVISHDMSDATVTGEQSASQEVSPEAIEITNGNSNSKVAEEKPSGQEAQSNTINVTQGKPDALATGELPSTEETPPDALKSTQGESHAESIEKQPTAQPDAVRSHDMSDATVTGEQSASQEVSPEAIEITNGNSNSKVAEEKPNGQHAQSEAVIGKSDASFTEEQTCGRGVQSEAVHSEFDTLFTEEQLSNALKTSECHAKVTKDLPSPQEAQPGAVSDKSNMHKDTTEEQPSTHVVQPEALKGKFDALVTEEPLPSAQEAQHVTHDIPDAKVTEELPPGQEAQPINVIEGKPDALATGDLPSAEETSPDAQKRIQSESHAEITEKQPTAQPDGVKCHHDMSADKAPHDDTKPDAKGLEAQPIAQGDQGQEAQLDAVNVIHDKFHANITKEELSSQKVLHDIKGIHDVSHAAVTEEQPSGQEAQPDTVMDTHSKPDVEEELFRQEAIHEAVNVTHNPNVSEEQPFGLEAQSVHCIVKSTQIESFFKDPIPGSVIAENQPNAAVGSNQELHIVPCKCGGIMVDGKYTLASEDLNVQIKAPNDHLVHHQVTHNLEVHPHASDKDLAVVVKGRIKLQISITPDLLKDLSDSCNGIDVELNISKVVKLLEK